MNLDEELRSRARQEETAVPPAFSQRVQETLDSLPRGKRRKAWRRWRRMPTVAAAAVLALVFVLPNSSAAMAQAMAELPVVGALFQVVTVRTYQEEDGKNHVSISTPYVVGDAEGSGAQAVNEQVEAYIDTLVSQYEQTAQADGYFNLDVTWEVVTNTQRWFTLRINSDLILASGNHQEQYYHIDAATGEQKSLSDLFPAEFDYVTAISDELKAQMKERMERDEREVYWLEGISELGTYFFDAIAPNQDFYFDDQGRIVIPFDKYEVGPGSTGSPRFVLTSPVLHENLLVRP